MKKSLRIALAIVALLTGFGTVRAQDNLDYYWVQSSGNNWNESGNWRVLRAATATTPAEYVAATELPDATNAVFINGTTPAGMGLPTPVSVPQNAPATVNIEVGAVGNGPLADASFAARSISFGGTIPAGTTVNFTINQPLTVGGVAAPGTSAVTANYRVAIRADSRLTVNGALTFGTTAGTSSLLVNQPVTITDALTVGSAASITANKKLRAGTLSVNAAASIIANDTLQVNNTMTVGAAATITTASNGLLLADALSFTATGATLTSNGTVNIANAVNVGAQIAIAVNKNFSAGSLSFTAGASTFAVGRSTAPIVTQASATISGAVSVNSNASITTHPNNSLSIGGNLSFANNNTGARFNINGAVTLGGSLLTVGPNNISSTNNAANVPTGSLTFTSAAVNTTIRSSGAVFNVPVTFNSASSGAIPGRWLLQDNMTIGYRVTFVNGYIEAPVYNSATLANSRMMILRDRAADGTIIEPFGASANSHVIGFFQKQALSVRPMEMPVGAGIVNGIKLFRPVIGTPSATNNATVKYFNANPKAALGQNNPANSGLTDISDREYWYVTSNNSNGLKISLSYDRPDFPATIESPPSEQYYFKDDPWRRNMLTVAGWRPGAGWSNRNGNDPPQINAQTKIITGTGSLSNNEFFTIASRGTAPLPVRLVAFSAGQLDGRVQLKWQSASEENTSHFEVEKSADGKNFAPLLTKKAQGNSASLVSYNAVDNHPLGGTSYYRLKMVDLDGTFEYSRLVSVSAEGTLLVKVYPNPSNGREVQFLAPNGDKMLLQSVSDAFGKAVGYDTTDVYAEGLYVSFYGSLPAGFYVATLVTDDDRRERVRVKFLVQ